MDGYGEAIERIYHARRVSGAEYHNDCPQPGCTAPLRTVLNPYEGVILVYHGEDRVSFAFTAAAEIVPWPGRAHLRDELLVALGRHAGTTIWLRHADGTFR